MEDIAKRLQDTVRTSSEESALLLPNCDCSVGHCTVPAVNAICSILVSHLNQPPVDSRNRRAASEGSYFGSHSRIRKMENPKWPEPQIVVMGASTEESEDAPAEDEAPDLSLGCIEREAFLKDFIAEHESQVVLWKEMESFKRDYNDMRGQVESLLAHLHMDFTSAAREASCNFFLLLSQLGCPSCTTGAGLEACSQHVKRVEGDLERTDIEKRSLATKVESLNQLKVQLQEKVDDRENVIQSLTETIEQLQNHCRGLEENSADAMHGKTLISSLEKTLRSIGRLVVEDSEIPNIQPPQLETSGTDDVSPNLVNLTLLAESTVTAVRAALLRRKTENQQLQNRIHDAEQKAASSVLERGDGESRERFLQKETLELRTQLALTLGEKQQLLDKSNQAEQLVKVTLQQLDEKDDTVRQLQDELEREKSGRRHLELKLVELQHEESMQRTSHSELLDEFRKLTSDNQLCRSNLASFEDKLNGLESEMSRCSAERTRLGAALELSKEEKGTLNRQLKELTEKSHQLQDQLRRLESDKLQTEESLARLQHLKKSDEDQLEQLTRDRQQWEKERLAWTDEKEELEEEVNALKRELVKAEELRMRLESLGKALERSLQTANMDNDEMKDQIEQLIQINNQLTEKQNHMERRCREIETGNNHLMEEMGKLSGEFSTAKEREENAKEERTKLQSRLSLLTEENEQLHQQLMGSQNAHQLTQVSLMATQANFDGLQLELERVTKEMQAVGDEKEVLLLELQDLQQSTSAVLSQLQAEIGHHQKHIAELESRLKKAHKDQVQLTETHEKEMQNLTLKMQQQLADLEHQMKMEAETQRAQHELQLETVRRDCEHQITKLQDELLRLETAKQNALALMQAEHQNLQEKLQSCIADLEAERAESSRLRREEVEKQLEQRLAAEAQRSEINRLQNELRQIEDARQKDQQSTAQILAAAKDHASKIEAELTVSRNDLMAANRDLKDNQRQIDSLHTQISKAESQCVERRQEEALRRQQLDQMRSERDGLRDATVALQATVKKFETDRDELVKCLEEARRRISVLEANRDVTEQQLVHLRTAAKEAEQQTDRMSKDLSGSQHQLHRTQDQQARWKERCEVLVEQLQAEQNRAILAEKAANEHVAKIQALKLHITQMESQFSTKLSQSGAQNSIHQQRIDEMDATVQKALLRSKRLEDERHNFHSRLIETHKESSLLKQRLREADTQSQDLTTQLHRLENEKKELANRLGSLLSTLRRFVRVLDDGQNKTTDYRNSSRFLQELSIPHDAESSAFRGNVSGCADADAIQTILHDLMRHILQLQSRRNVPDGGGDEPTRLDSQRQRSTDRQRLVSRLRDSDASTAGLRQRLSASLSAVASRDALSPQTLIRESNKLDGLVSNVAPNM